MRCRLPRRSVKPVTLHTLTGPRDGDAVTPLPPRRCHRPAACTARRSATARRRCGLSACRGRRRPAIRGPRRLHAQIRSILLDDTRPDALYQREFLDAAKRAVLGAVLDDGLGASVTDAHELARERRSIRVLILTGSASAGGTAKSAGTQTSANSRFRMKCMGVLRNDGELPRRRQHTGVERRSVSGEYGGEQQLQTGQFHRPARRTRPRLMRSHSRQPGQHQNHCALCRPQPSQL
jgi:hypothetical protein